MDFLEYSDISAEIKGCRTSGKVKMTDQNIIFKNSKTGKVEQIQAGDMDMVNFQYFADNLGIRIFLKNGTLHRFYGFRESEKEKIAKFFTATYKKDMLEKELSLKGWNWGTAKFNGSVLSFDIGNNSAFEIPLNHVSQCNTGKNEITMEFHQNDDAPVSLMEMRFYIPSNELAGDLDPVEAFQQQVMQKASVISVSGDAISIFREIQCLTPRGRYDIKIFQSFFQLHGKTFDYKIPMSTVLRLFVLPHKDSRQMFFVVSLDPPIKQGQTRYHFLVLLFGLDEETSIELPFSEEELKEKYEGKLDKEVSGPTYEVLAKVMKVIINRKITGPGTFIGHSGTPAVGCSFKAAAGYLYPLERGFIYVHKPPIHIRFEEIASVNFARGGGSTRSFDFEVELKSSTVHTFSSIEKEEYGKLFDFITSKKLNVKNRGKNDKASYKDDFGDSDNEAVPDAYLERVKAEAQERDDDENVSDEESTDDDFNPDQVESDVAEEYDSNHSTDSEEDSDDSGGGGSGSERKKEKKLKKEKKEKERKERKPRTAKTVSERPRRRKEKKEKDENKPKRPATAFMLWLNDNRESIKTDNPGLKVTEIAKKAGELWRDIKDKPDWEKKANKLKEDYAVAMKEYEDSGAAAAFKEKAKQNKKEASVSSTAKSKSTSSVATKKKAVNVSPPKSGFKSKEYIETDSSSDEEKRKSKKKASKAGSDEDEKKSDKKKDSDASSGEDDDKKKSAKKKGSDASSNEDDDDDKKTKKPDKRKGSDDEGKGSDKKKSKGKGSGSEDAEDEEEAESTPASSDDSD